jgi:hypothetical protein
MLHSWQVFISRGDITAGMVIMMCGAGLFCLFLLLIPILGARGRKAWDRLEQRLKDRY